VNVRLLSSSKHAGPLEWRERKRTEVNRDEHGQINEMTQTGWFEAWLPVSAVHDMRIG
jgi:hypothetical protein